MYICLCYLCLYLQTFVILSRTYFGNIFTDQAKNEIHTLMILVLVAYLKQNKIILDSTKCSVLKLKINTQIEKFICVLFQNYY